MSIYVARSPYRSSFSSRPKVRIQFPNISEFFAKRNARAAARKRRHMRVLPGASSGGFMGAFSGGAAVLNGAHAAAGATGGIAQRGRMERREKSGSLNVGAAARRIKEAVMRIEFGPSTAIGGLLVISILLGLLYLAHFNQVATKGYDLRRLEADRQQLLNQYDIKNMKLAEVKSLTNILKTNRISAMRKPAEVIFVRANTAVAQVESL